jgi:hypothetical protein
MFPKLSLLAVLALAACGGGGGGEVTPVPPPVVVPPVTPPTGLYIVSSLPAEGASLSTRSQSPKATFSADLVPSTVSNQSVSMYGPLGNQIVTDVVPDGPDATVTPRSYKLPGDSVYKIKYGAGIWGTNNKAVDPSVFSSFGTPVQKWDANAFSIGASREFKPGSGLLIRHDEAGNPFVLWDEDVNPQERRYMLRKINARTGTMEAPVELFVERNMPNAQIVDFSVGLRSDGDVMLAVTTRNNYLSSTVLRYVASTNKVIPLPASYIKVPEDSTPGVVSVIGNSKGNVQLFTFAYSKTQRNANGYPVITGVFTTDIGVSAPDNTYTTTFINSKLAEIEQPASLARARNGSATIAWRDVTAEGVQAIRGIKYTVGRWFTPSWIEYLVTMADPASRISDVQILRQNLEAQEGDEKTALIWRQLDKGASGAKLYASSGTGESVVRLDQSGATTSGVSEPRAVIDSLGNVTVAWLQSEGVYSRRFDVTAKTWLTPQLLYAGVVKGHGLGIDVVGNVTSVMGDGRTMNSRQYLLSKGGWQAVVSMGASTGLNAPAGSVPRLTVDEAGTATVVWLSRDAADGGKQYSILGKRFE